VGLVSRVKNVEKGFNLIETLLALVVIVAISAGAVIVSHHVEKNHLKASESTSKTTTQTTPPSSQSTASVLSQNATNSSRKTDVAEILAAVNEYISNNNGTLPKSTATGSTANALLVCDTHCTASNSSKASLGFYTPPKVVFHAYASSLTIPDDSTVYIVTGATCSANNSIGTPVNSVSTLALYALQNGSSITQQCQVS
jgi:prepilin-type N-terminal cleavage/methylation domain-containing protein